MEAHGGRSGLVRKGGSVRIADDQLVLLGTYIEDECRTEDVVNDHAVPRDSGSSFVTPIVGSAQSFLSAVGQQSGNGR